MPGFLDQVGGFFSSLGSKAENFLNNAYSTVSVCLSTIHNDAASVLGGARDLVLKTEDNVKGIAGGATDAVKGGLQGVTNTAQTLVTTAGQTAQSLGNNVQSVASGLFNSPVLMIAAAAAAFIGYKYISGEKEKK